MASIDAVNSISANNATCARAELDYVEPLLSFRLSAESPAFNHLHMVRDLTGLNAIHIEVSRTIITCIVN